MLSTVAAVVIGEFVLMKEKTAMRRSDVQNGFKNSRMRNSSGNVNFTNPTLDSNCTLKARPFYKH